MPSQFIMIENDAEMVSRISLEKLGLSTKRDDARTIGRFGSGVKFAPISALRNGWRWIFTGSDKHGDYTLEYASKDEDGIMCVVYDYGTYQKDSSFTVDAGGLSWTDSFQIYREAIANAMDEAAISDGSWSVSIVNEEDICVAPGKFRVYITASPEMLAIHNDFDKYFCINRKVISDEHGFKFLEKIDGSLRVYSHGVLVYENTEFDSLFDYEIADIELNEERRIRSEFTLGYKVASAIAHTRNHNVIRKILRSITSPSYYEFDIPESNFTYASFSCDWEEIFEELYGHDRVIVTADHISSGVDHILKTKGYKPLFVEKPTISTILTKNQVKTAALVLGETSDYKIIGNVNSFPALAEAYRIASHFEPGLSEMKDRIDVFVGQSDTVYGLAINMDRPIEERKILIEERALESPLYKIIGTLIHEYDHVVSGNGDSTVYGARAHRDLADDRIGKMFIEHYKVSTIDVDVDRIHIPVKNAAELHSLTYEVSATTVLNKSIVRIGQRHFVVDFYNSCEEHSGHGYVSTAGDSIVFDMPSEILDVKEL